jgi:hypothetical protein
MAILLQDNFSSDPSGPVSSTLWSYPTGPAEFIPSTLGPGFPGTETAPFLPSVSNGALQLTLQTYNPTGPGTSFQGSAIFSNQSFNPTAGGIAFTAVAKLATTVPGMDGGIFAYGLNSPTSHNEIDSELLSDIAAGKNNQELTNIYHNAPPNTVGNPVFTPDPSLTDYQTYTMEWFPNEVLWFINGQLVRQDTTHVPQGSMQFYLNFWAYDAGASLQPTANPMNNTTYTFDVKSVNVASIGNPPPPADMILRHGSDGRYEIYDIVSNSIVAAGPLGQVGTDYQFQGLGNFFGADTTDMILRSATTGNFQVYDISSNNITGSAALGAVGMDYQVAGFGQFNGGSATDMMLRSATTGAFEVYDISNNAITGAAALGTVGTNWVVAGVGDFNHDGSTDMMLRDGNTGTFEAYDIVNNRIVSATTLGAVGLDWQVAGFGDFNGDGTTDMMLRNTTTGAFEVYGIQNNQIVTAAAIGTVGLDWQVAGFGDFNGDGQSDMVLRNSNTGAFEVYDIANFKITAAAGLGTVGTDWALGGFAAAPPTAASSSQFASTTATAQLVQAMAAFSAAGPAIDNGAIGPSAQDGIAQLGLLAASPLQRAG